MWRAIFRHEFLIMLQSRKNIFFIIALLSLLLSYSFFILPTLETGDAFDVEETKAEIETIDVIREGMIERGGTGVGGFTGQAPYAQDTRERNVLSRMVYAFQDEDFNRFTQLRMKVVDQSVTSQTNDWMLIGEAPYPALDSMRDSGLTQERYSGYIQSGVPLTYEIIEQKSALQVIINFLLGTASAFVIFSAIYFSNDMLSRDKRHQSVLQGLPIGWYSLINMKSFVTFIYTLLILGGFFLLAVLIISIQTGFGSFQLPVPITIPSTLPDDFFGYRYSEYDSITIGRFLLFTLGILPLLLYLFIRISAILNLLFKNAWVVLMIAVALLFSERIYYARTFRELFGIDLSFFPQTYFDFGRIISGEKYYLLHLESITYERGILVLLVTIGIVEIILFIMSRLINRRRFYHSKA
jgi:hypothetical protein